MIAREFIKNPLHKAENLQHRIENNIFQNGDRVECIDAAGQRYLKLGKIYTVSTPDRENKFYVDGYRRYSFLKTRFKIVGISNDQ